MNSLNRSVRRYNTDSLIDLTKKIPKIRSICGQKQGSNGIAVVGNQSAGKTMLIRSLTGFDIFVTKDGAATKRPTLINIVNNTVDDTKYGKFGEFGEKIYDMNKLGQLMAEKNDGDFSKKPIEVTLYTPDVPDLLITDFPGHINTVRIEDDDRDIPQIIEEMSIGAIMDDNTHKLLVMNASVDRAGSIPLGLIQRKKQFHNTTAVITKCDLIVNPNESGVSPEHGRNKLLTILKDPYYSRHMDFHGVCLRSSAEVLEGITVEDKILSEQKLKDKYNLNGLLTEKDVKYLEEKFRKDYDGNYKVEDRNIYMGIPGIRQKLSEVFVQKSIGQLPSLSEGLNRIKSKKESERDMIGTLSSNPEIITEISASTEEMFDALGNNSYDRVTIEKRIKKKIDDLVRNAVEGEFEKHFNIDFESEIVDTVQTPDARILNKMRSVYNHPSIFRVQDNINAHLEKHYDTTRFGKFADPTTNKEVYDSNTAHIAKHIPMSFFRFEKTGYTKENKNHFMRKLSSIIDGIITKRNLPDECRTVSVNTLKESLKEFRPETSDNLTWEFFEYVYNKIAQRTENDGLIDSLKRVIYKEKTPYADPSELAWHTMNMPHNKNRGWQDSVIPFFDTELYPEIRPIYGPTWKTAYKEILIDRISKNMHSMINVSLSQPLVRETLEQSFRFFQNKDFTSENSKLEKEISEIEEFQELVADAEELAIQLNDEYQIRKDKIAFDLEKSKNKQKNSKKFDINSAFD